MADPALMATGTKRKRSYPAVRAIHSTKQPPYAGMQTFNSKDDMIELTPRQGSKSTENHSHGAQDKHTYQIHRRRRFGGRVRQVTKSRMEEQSRTQNDGYLERGNSCKLSADVACYEIEALAYVQSLKKAEEKYVDILEKAIHDILRQVDLIVDACIVLDEQVQSFHRTTHEVLRKLQNLTTDIAGFQSGTASSSRQLWNLMDLFDRVELIIIALLYRIIACPDLNDLQRVLVSQKIQPAMMQIHDLMSENGSAKGSAICLKASVDTYTDEPKRGPSDSYATSRFASLKAGRRDFLHLCTQVMCEAQCRYDRGNHDLLDLLLLHGMPNKMWQVGWEQHLDYLWQTDQIENIQIYLQEAVNEISSLQSELPMLQGHWEDCLKALARYARMVLERTSPAQTLVAERDHVIRGRIDLGILWQKPLSGMASRALRGWAIIGGVMKAATFFRLSHVLCQVDRW